MALFAALVFTDVEGSTALWDRHASAFGGALARHDAILREGIARHGGHELATMGDAFAIRFASVAQAAAFCVEGQAALAAEPWAVGPVRVRMGMHWGEVGPDPLSGAAATLAERVASAGHGGQILLSEAAHVALPAELGPVLSLGAFALKGLPGEHALHQLGAGAFPPPRARTRAGNLRPRPTPMVGRIAERAALQGLMEGGGAPVLLVGPGGVGKSRLAEAAAEDAIAQGAEGAWRVDLAPVRDESALIGAVAQALELPVGAGAAEQVGHAIAARGRVVLLLDGAEHLTAAARSRLLRWAQMAPEARVLVTSRVSFGLPRELRLEPLPPADAATLFERLSGRSDPELPALLAALDGLPLAIELAAARAHAMPAATLLAGLRDRASRDALQGALDACLAWSWDLLPPEAQDALARLTIFRGGFTLDAAEAVLGWDALDLVQILVEQSWLTLDRASGRYGLLDSVAAFGAARLSEATRAEAEASHMAFYVAFGAPDRLEALSTSAYMALAPALRAELGNLEAAARRAKAAGQIETATRLALVMWANLRREGSLDLASELLLPLARAVGSDSPLAVQVTGACMTALTRGGQPREAIRLAEARLAELPAPGPALTCSLLGGLALAQRTVGAALEGRANAARAVELSEGLAPPRGRMATLQALGIIEFEAGRFTSAEACYREALALEGAAQDPLSYCQLLGNLGNVCRELGRVHEAFARYEAAIEIGRQNGDPRNVALALGNLGLIRVAVEDWQGARKAFEDAFRAHRALGNLRSASVVQGNLGNLLMQLGDHEGASLALEGAVAGLGAVHDAQARYRFLAVLARAYASTGRPERCAALLDEAEAGLTSLGARYQLLCARVDRCHVLLTVGRRDEARALLLEIQTEISATHETTMGLGHELTELAIRLGVSPTG